MKNTTINVEEAIQTINKQNKRIEDLNIINEEHRVLNGMIRNQLQQKENIIKGLDNTIENLEEVVEHKENIIKEVREYINNHLYMESTGGIQHPTFDGKMNRDTNGFEILEILEKEVN